MNESAPDLVTINHDLPIDMLREIVTGLRSGEIKLVCPAGLDVTDEIKEWLGTVNSQMLAKYEAELRLRTN